MFSKVCTDGAITNVYETTINRLIPPRGMYYNTLDVLSSRSNKPFLIDNYYRKKQDMESRQANAR